jgi:hypothetical protein
VFPAEHFPNLRTFKLDLVAAGLAKIVKDDDGNERFDCDDEDGRSLDFHCLRVSFVSGLVAANVHPQVAQALARHAKIETTMGAYTELTSLDLRGGGGAAGAAAVEGAPGGCPGVGRAVESGTPGDG